MTTVRRFAITCLLLAILGGCKPEQSRGIAFLAWSPDGLMLASIYEGVILVGDSEGMGAFRKFENLSLAENTLSWSPDGGCIAYTSDRDGSWNIYILNVKTGESARLTKHPAKDMSPVWLPPGRCLIFLSYRGKQPDLWMYDFEIDGFYQLTSDSALEEQVTFTQDGSRIAYLSRHRDGTVDIKVMDVEDQLAITLVSKLEEVTSVCIAPNGRKVCYTTPAGLHIANVPIAHLPVRKQLVVRGGESPITHAVWSPDGKNILFQRDGKGWLRNLEWFGSTKPLAPTPGGDRLHCWSPDGGSVAYAAGVQLPHHAVAVVNIKTGKRRWLVGSLEDANAVAEYLEKVEQWDEMARFLRASLDRFGLVEGSGIAVERLTEAYFRTGDYENLLRLHRETTKDRTALGLAYLLCFGDLERAKIHLKKALEKGDKSAKRYLDFIENQPQDVVRLYCRAELARRRGDYGKAAEKIAEFLRKAPANYLAEKLAYDLGDIYLKELNNPQRAIEAYERALEAFPKSERWAEAVFAIAETFERLGEPDRALEFYRRNASSKDIEVRRKALYSIAKIARERNDRKLLIKTLSELLESVPPVDEKDPAAVTLKEERNKEKLNLLIRLIQLRLDSKERELALSTAMRIGEVFKGDKEEQRKVLPKLLLAFDEKGFHEEADELLKWAAGYGRIEIRLTDAIDSWLKILRLAPTDVLIECRLESLPEWLVRRVRLLADLIEAQKGAEEEAVFLKLVAARTPDGVESLLGCISSGRGEAERLSPAARPLLLAAGNYILGNYYQTKGEIKTALDYYIRMHEAVNDEVTLKTLRYCRRICLKNPELVQEWFDLERDTGHGIWEGMEGVLGKPPKADEALPLYREFATKHAEGELTPHAYLRVAQCSEGAAREYYLKKVVRDYPNCDMFGEAFEELTSYYYSRANYWLAAQFISDLLVLEEHRSHFPLYLLELSKIYGEMLKDIPSARKYIAIIFEGYRGTEEWAFAKRLQASYLMDEKRWQEAIDEIQDLVNEMPDYEWVQEGRALHTIAQCHEQMGDWKKAEEEYINLITHYRHSMLVKTAKVLARIMPKLSTEAKRKLYARFPMDFVKAAPQLSKEEREKLFILFPDLPKKISQEIEKELKGEE